MSYERPLAHHIHHALEELQTPVDYDTASAMAAVLQHDGVADLYLEAVAASIRAHRARTARREGRRQHGQ